MDSMLKKLAKNSLILFNANFAVLVINFAFIYFAIRYLGLYNFGIYTLLLTPVALVENFASLGLYPVFVSEIARSLGKKDIGEAKSIVYNFGQIQVIIGVLSGLLFFAVAYFNFFKLDPVSVNAVYGFGVYLLLVGFRFTIQLLLEGIQRFDLSTRFTVVESAGKMILLAGFLFFHAPGSVFYMSLVILGGYLAGLISIAWPFWKQAKPWLAVPRKKENFFINLVKEQGIYAFFTHQVRNVKSNFYPWIIKFCLGVEAVAVYSVLEKIQNSLMKVVQPIDQALLPLFSEMQETEDVKKVHNRITKYSFWINSALVLVVIAIIPFFLTAYIGKSYPGQELTQILLLLTLPFFAMTFPMRSLLYRFREQAYIFKLATFMTVFWFVTTAAFAILWGLVGAGLSSFFFFIVEFYLQKYYLQKKHGISFRILDFFSIDAEDKALFKKLKHRIIHALKRPIQ